MPNQRHAAEHARAVTGHPMFKTERQALILIAKTFPSLRGVEFGKETSANIYLRVMDALKPAVRPQITRAILTDSGALKNLRKSAQSADRSRHLDCVGTHGGKACTETIYAH